MRRISVLTVAVLLSAFVGTPPVSGASFTAETTLPRNAITVGLPKPAVTVAATYRGGVRLNVWLPSVDGEAPAYHLAYSGSGGENTAFDYPTGVTGLQSFGFGCRGGAKYTIVLTSKWNDWISASDPLTVTCP